MQNVDSPKDTSHRLETRYSAGPTATFDRHSSLLTLSLIHLSHSSEPKEEEMEESMRPLKRAVGWRRAEGGERSAGYQNRVDIWKRRDDVGERGREGK